MNANNLTSNIRQGKSGTVMSGWAAGLGIFGPWNQPETERRVFSLDSTSATWKIKKGKKEF